MNLHISGDRRLRDGLWLIIFCVWNIWGYEAVTWQPVHPKHAIERTRIVVQFKEPLPSKTVLKIGKEFDLKRSDFGFSDQSEVQMQALTVSQSNQSPALMSSQGRGWQYVRETAPGVALEALIFQQEYVIYENAEYIRWADFWNRASSMLGNLINQASDFTDMRLFALEYFDRFVFSGPQHLASPQGLIQHNLTDTLSSAAQSGEELWHIHRGWYDSINNIRVLINQNIDANDVQNPKGESVRSVSIYTKVERRNRSEVVDANQFDDDMVKMHKVSKDIFRGAISENMLKAIGIEETKDA